MPLMASLRAFNENDCPYNFLPVLFLSPELYWRVLHSPFLTFWLPNATHLSLADSVDQDQTAQNVQSDLDLHCPIWRYITSRNKSRIT